MSSSPPFTHYIFKLIFIGDSNTGKTSIINRFVHNTFNERHVCTIGVDFMMKTLIINSNEIKLQIWDTAGMEKYKQITTSYYRGAQGAIVVFDLSSHSSFESVQQWIDEFCQITCTEANTGDKMIILVGNKSDLVMQRQVSQEEIEKFVETNKIAYYETSALSGKGVQDMFETFANALMRKYIGKSLGMKDSKTKRINFQLGVGNNIDISNSALLNNNNDSNNDDDDSDNEHSQHKNKSKGTCC